VSPEELTRPLRMNSLDLSIRFMERQIKTQEKELEVLLPSLYNIKILEKYKKNVHDQSIKTVTYDNRNSNI